MRRPKRAAGSHQVASRDRQVRRCQPDHLSEAAPGKLVSPRGHVVDHIALSVQDLKAVLDRLKKSGVRVLENPRKFGRSTQMSAMIEGPDSIAIELVEKP
ncbi:MAG: VOC family protein [Acidobacteria bacterium]|nr:VOC family protein [Acidobacteriota bacterium]